MGRQLAKALSYPYIDTDNYICEQTNSSITDIFATKGEAHFRDLEHQCLLELSKSTKAYVISTGGGLAVHHQHINLINTSGYSIYLQADASFLYSRLRKSQHKRPLIANKSKSDCIDTLNRIKKERETIYQQATICVQAMGASPQKLLQKLQEETNWQWQAS